jgi:hypothetical protein
VPEIWNDLPFQHLLPASGCVAVALTRACQAMLPSPEKHLETGDVMQLSATLEGIQAMRKRLSKEPGG